MSIISFSAKGNANRRQYKICLLIFNAECGLSYFKDNASRKRYKMNLLILASPMRLQK